MERKSWVNLRGVAIIAVVVIHLTSGKYDPISFDGSFNLILNQLSRFAVPVFFISSGYGLFVTKKHELLLKKYYFGRYKIIIPIYIFWTLVYFVLTGSQRNLSALVFDLLTGEGSYHLYYLLVLILFYLIYPFVYQFFSTRQGLIISLVLTLIFQCLLQFNIDIFGMGPSNLFNWLAYFSLGIYFGKNQNKLRELFPKEKSLFLIGMLAVLMPAFGFYLFTNRSSDLFTSSMRPSVFLFTLAVLSVFLKRFYKPNKILSELDKNSLTIYAVHPIFIMVVNKVLKIMGLYSNRIIISIISIVIVIVLSYFFSYFTSLILKRSFSYKKSK